MLGAERPLRTHGRRHIPMPTGPHPVGCFDLLTEPAGPGDKGVLMRLFYPADPDLLPKDPHLYWPLWTPRGKYLAGYASYLKIWSPVAVVANKMNGIIYIPAVWNATPNRKAGSFPVVVFSHGLAACRLTYSTICMELASHGYVVAAIEHSDESACATFRFNDNLSREWIMRKRVSKKNGSPIRREQLTYRAQECSALLEVLDRVAAGEEVRNLLDPDMDVASVLSGLMRLDDVSIAGHSFGGATVILCLANNPRFRLGLALDPWMVPFQFDKDALKGITKPLLIVNMEAFWTAEHREILRNVLDTSAERLVVTLRGTAHLNQSDLPFCLMGPLSRALFVGFTRMDRFRAIDLTSSLMLRFLGQHEDEEVRQRLQSKEADFIANQDNFFSVNKRKMRNTFTDEVVTLRAGL